VFRDIGPGDWRVPCSRSLFGDTDAGFAGPRWAGNEEVSLGLVLCTLGRSLVAHCDRVTRSGPDILEKRQEYAAVLRRRLGFWGDSASVNRKGPPVRTFKKCAIGN